MSTLYREDLTYCSQKKLKRNLVCKKITSYKSDCKIIGAIIQRTMIYFGRQIYCCLFLFLFAIKSNAQHQIQVLYSPGLILKWWTPKYESFKENLIISPNNKFDLQWARIGKKIGYSIGFTYSIENIPFNGKVILEDNKYESVWMRDYKSFFLDIPIGLWIKLNRNEMKSNLIIVETSLSIFTHEEYSYHDGEISYTPTFSDPIVIDSENNIDYFGINRWLISLKFDRETPIGQNLMLARGASISLPSIYKGPGSTLELSNLKINGFIGVGYLF